MLLDPNVLSAQEVLNNSKALGLSNEQSDLKKEEITLDNVDICCMLQSEIQSFYRCRGNFCEKTERLKIVTDFLNIEESKTKKEKYFEIEKKTGISESTCRNSLFDLNNRPSPRIFAKLTNQMDQNENNEAFWCSFGWYPVPQNNNPRKTLIENRLKELANEDQRDLQNWNDDLFSVYFSVYEGHLSRCVFLESETFANAIVGKKPFQVQSVYHLLIYFVSDELNGRDVSNEDLEEKYHLFGIHPLSEGSVDDIVKICIIHMSPYVRLTNEVRRAEVSLKEAEEKKVTDIDKYLKTFRKAYENSCHDFWLLLRAILSDYDQKYNYKFCGRIMTLVRDPLIEDDQREFSEELTEAMKQRVKLRKEEII